LPLFSDLNLQQLVHILYDLDNWCTSTTQVQLYFDAPLPSNIRTLELLAIMKSQSNVEESAVRRRSEIQLHFFPDFVDPMHQSQQLLVDDIPPEDFVIMACTASFGGDSSGPTMEGAETLAFGHGDGVPVVRGWNNTLGCTPYTESFHGEAILVHRGECTFLEKLLHALNAGASGVVAINGDDSKVWPSAGAQEIADVGKILDTGALVVITRSAGRTLERMLDAAEDLDGNVWMTIGAEPASSDSLPIREPTRTQREPSSELRMLYINGHSLINTRMG
jgi:ER degradation enhancer, mannosidase alpha-like 1